MSQATTRHSAGTPSRPTSGATAVGPAKSPPAAEVSARIAVSRPRVSRGRSRHGTMPLPGSRIRAAKTRMALHASTRTARRSPAPHQPCGHASRPPGASARSAAVAATHRAGTDAATTTAVPRLADTGRITAASSPSPVPSGAAGAATTFARTPAMGRPSSSRRRNGDTAICAARAMPMGSRSQRGSGTKRLTARSMPGPSSRIPAVAATDSAKPGARDCQGSRSRSADIASPSAGSARARRPPKSAACTTDAMTAARCTLGSGPTTKTNAPRARAPSATRTRCPAPNRPATPMTAPVTRAQFAPDTAVRCASELPRRSASSAGVTREVSPTAKPGTSSAPGTPAAASRRSARRSAAAVPAHPRTPSTEAGEARAIERFGSAAATRRPKAADDPGSRCTGVPRTRSRAPGPQVGGPPPASPPARCRTASSVNHSTTGTRPGPAVARADARTGPGRALAGFGSPGSAGAEEDSGENASAGPDGAGAPTFT